MSFKFLSLALAAVATASPFDSMQKATNDDPYEACQPQGASSTAPPAVGTELSSLYTDILSSIQGITFDKRSVHSREDGFGCRQSLDCVNVQNINVPMCYDKFTTNFQFPDGSFGNVAAGTYNSGGTEVNLVSGNYTKDGQNANIYANNEAERPNTSTLSVPAQFTGTGVGGAVPVTELGSIIVYTTTVSAETFSAPTTIPETVQVATISGQEVSTTVPARTITQATTISAHTDVVTQTNTAAAAPSSTGAAGQVSVDTTRSFGMSVVGALLYALL